MRCGCGCCGCGGVRVRLASSWGCCVVVVAPLISKLGTVGMTPCPFNLLRGILAFTPVKDPNFLLVPPVAVFWFEAVVSAFNVVVWVGTKILWVGIYNSSTRITWYCWVVREGPTIWTSPALGCNSINFAIISCGSNWEYDNSGEVVVGRGSVALLLLVLSIQPIFPPSSRVNGHADNCLATSLQENNKKTETRRRKR